MEKKTTYYLRHLKKAFFSSFLAYLRNDKEILEARLKED